MHFAEGGGVVAVQFEDFGNRRGLVGPNRIVAWGAGREFGNRAHPDRMMVVAGQQCLACRRAERGGMELGIAEAALRKGIERRAC